jgi:TonB family protein
MSHHCRNLHSIAFVLALCLVVSVAAGADDLQQHLRDQYQGKTRLLRGFYSGDSLLYDSSGLLIGKEITGDWSDDGFVALDDIHTIGPRLVIEGRRLLVTRLTPEFAFTAARRRSADGKDVGPVVLKIDVDFGTNAPSAAQADAVISKIFLTEQDSLADLVPEYWKPCVPEGLTGKNKNCNFSDKVLAIPGVVPSQNGSVPVRPLGDQSQFAENGKMVSLEKGMSPPKAISSPDPEFSDGARGVKYQGVAILGLVVNAEGKPIKVRVVTPLGAGLDAKAVHAVESWKFEPARRNNQPTAMDIMVEVDFHLY